MGLLSFFTSKKDKSPEGESFTGARPIAIDITTFRVGDTVLGERPSEKDFFAKPLQQSDVFEVAAMGIELGSKDGVLDYAFLTIGNFSGQIRTNGDPVEVRTDSTEASIRKSFEEPYWIDRSDGEVILFYEYAAGTIELQFEFLGSGSLGFVTLSRNGVLSTEEQRKLHGVDKPWPPI